MTNGFSLPGLYRERPSAGTVYADCLHRPQHEKEHRTGEIGFSENTSGLNGRNAIERKRQDELAGADPPDEEPGHPHD